MDKNPLLAFLATLWLSCMIGSLMLAAMLVAAGIIAKCWPEAIMIIVAIVLVAITGYAAEYLYN